MAGFFEIDFLEMDFRSRPGAGEFGDVCGNDVTDLWVASDGLAFAHEDDGLAVLGDLDGAEDNGLGNEFAGFFEFERSAVEAGACAIG